jgi:hypothetical protein
VGPRAGLNDVEKRKFLTLPGLELQSVASRYPGSHRKSVLFLKVSWGGVRLSPISTSATNPVLGDR